MSATGGDEGEEVALAEVEADFVEEVALAPRPGNPCQALTNLARADGPLVQVSTKILNGVASVREVVFGESMENKSYDGVDIVNVNVRKREIERPRGGIRKQWSYALKTRARMAGCDVEVLIGGGGIHRSISDFEWLRATLNHEYAGCVVPPMTAEAYEGDASVLERFLAQCVAHAELSHAPELSAFCMSDGSEFEVARAAFDAMYARRPPLVVRVGAMVLDVVGDATPVTAAGADVTEDDASAAEVAAARRREQDVRELHAWARDQLTVISRCERECASGAAALQAFDDACASTKTALASRFEKAAAAAAAAAAASSSSDPRGTEGSFQPTPEPHQRTSGPHKALRALRQMSGLARALCDAIEGRETLRLQLVSSRNALHLNEVSRDARGAMIEASAVQRRSAEDLAAKLAEEDAAKDAAAASGKKKTTAGAATAAAAGELGAKKAINIYETTVDPENNDDAATVEDVGLLGRLKGRALGLGRTGLDASLAVAQKVRTTVSSREEAGQTANQVVEISKRVATQLRGLGLRVASRVADGAAYVSSTDNDVQAARELVAKLEALFAVADERLRRDAPDLKNQWDALQIDAFDAFAQGEATRATEAQLRAESTAAELAVVRSSTSTPTTPPIAPP